MPCSCSYKYTFGHFNGPTREATRKVPSTSLRLLARQKLKSTLEQDGLRLELEAEQSKRTNLVAAPIFVVAGDRVHQRRPRGAQRGGGRGRPRRHDPHVVGERPRREEAPAAARRLRGVPHEARRREEPPAHATCAPRLPRLLRCETETKQAPKQALASKQEVEEGGREEAEAETEQHARQPEPKPSRSESIADAPGLFLWGLGGTLAEKQPTDRISGARHGRAQKGGGWGEIGTGGREA